ncbi:MAG TPA: hypothetical protein VK464_21990, partial [Symbiobacteriaceae bacterium]|nr:hypothetical protein [Symbiobacteriaceae bacterium]
MFQSDLFTSSAGVVRSVQTLTVPCWAAPSDGAAAAAVAQAGRLYWQFLRRFGRGLLQIDEHPNGAVSV